MNIIQFFEQKTIEWNKSNHCNSCWTFGAPLSEAEMNATRHDDDACCVHLFVTTYRTTSGYQRTQTGLISRVYTDHHFVLYAVRHARLGINTYSEQPHHPIDESLWKTHIEPLQKCLGKGHEIDFCGSGLEIQRWDMDVVKQYNDMNYTGWKITGTFRENH